MKTWLVARTTYRGLLRNRAVFFLVLLMLLVFLRQVSTLFFATQLSSAGAREQAQGLFASGIESALGTYAVFGFMVALLAAAYVLPGEVKTGTILPTLGRAVSRGDYLLGLYLGVNLLFATYLGLVAVLVGILLAWGGIVPPAYLLLGCLYVFLWANILGAVVFFFSVLMHPLLALVTTWLVLSLGSLGELARLYSQAAGNMMERVTQVLLPAWALLPYGEYFRLTRTPAAHDARFFLVGAAHGFDYIVVFLVLAYLAFRRRALLPPS